MINLNCAAYVADKLCFTNAGALFFRINDEDVKFRHAGIVCALYKGIDKTYIIDAKELNSDIISNVDESLAFLKRHLNISYKIETLQRENILELPEDALREAVVNAVCHRNYFEKGARVTVEIFDDRVEITNPGGVCKGITSKNFGKISLTRNSVIASMLYRIDYIEQMGTGILRMKNAAKNANVAEPKFDLHDFFKATFLRNQAFEQVTPQVRELLKIFKGEMNRTEIQENLNLSDRENLRLNYIQPALKQGFIELVYPDRPNHPQQKYRLTKIGKGLS
ncbi:MAG: hypothetical protein FWH22_11705 [Fibromonadales bacterium]|nr:hypothetical protein [Fibromonadales bacterium]